MTKPDLPDAVNDDLIAQAEPTAEELREAQALAANWAGSRGVQASLSPEGESLSRVAALVRLGSSAGMEEGQLRSDVQAEVRETLLVEFGASKGTAHSGRENWLPSHWWRWGAGLALTFALGLLVTWRSSELSREVVLRGPTSLAASSSAVVSSPASTERLAHVLAPFRARGAISQIVGQDSQAVGILKARQELFPVLPAALASAYKQWAGAGTAAAQISAYEQLARLKPEWDNKPGLFQPRNRESGVIFESVNVVLDWFCRITEAALRLKRAVDARQWAEQGLVLAEEQPNVFIAQLWELHGRALRMAGNREAAASSFARAIEIHEQLLDRELESE